MKIIFLPDENFLPSGCKFQQIIFPIQNVWFPCSFWINLPHVAKPAKLILAPFMYSVAFLLRQYLPASANAVCVYS